MKSLPCPFCGKMPSISKGGPGNLVWYIACERGDHVASIQYSGPGEKESAIEMWNTRVSRVSPKAAEEAVQ